MSSSTSSDPALRATERYDSDFLDREELRLIEDFEERGYHIFDIEDRSGLDRIRRAVANQLSKEIGTPFEDISEFLNRAADRVSVADLNSVRLGIFNAVNRESWFRSTYYKLARGVLATLVGNELAMQRRINLSIQLPGDESSLLPVHSDVWSGDSAFEVVVWVPLVDCYSTKSMFILPRKLNDEHSKRLPEFQGKDTEELFRAIEPDVEWVTVSVGQGLIFTHTLMHGNRRNEENEARWSMNCRFKSLLSPYDSKRLGEFFEPITLRAATRLGMTYTLPKGFER